MYGRSGLPDGKQLFELDEFSNSDVMKFEIRGKDPRMRQMDSLRKHVSNLARHGLAAVRIAEHNVRDAEARQQLVQNARNVGAQFLSAISARSVEVAQGARDLGRQQFTVNASHAG